MVIITGISYITYSNVKKSARDAQRKSDLVTIARALEEFKSDHGQYPHTFSTITTVFTGTERSAFNLLQDGGNFYYLGDDYCQWNATNYNIKEISGGYLDFSNFNDEYYYFSEFWKGMRNSFTPQLIDNITELSFGGCHDPVFYLIANNIDDLCYGDTIGNKKLYILGTKLEREEKTAIEIREEYFSFCDNNDLSDLEDLLGYLNGNGLNHYIVIKDTVNYNYY